MIGDFRLNSENDSGNQESQPDASHSFFNSLCSIECWWKARIVILELHCSYSATSTRGERNSAAVSVPFVALGWHVLPLYAVDIWLNCAPLLGHLHYGYGSPRDWPIYSDKGGWFSKGYPKLCRINGAASTGRCMKHNNRLIKPTVVAILLSRITMVRMWCPSRCIADLQRALTIDKMTT